MSGTESSSSSTIDDHGEVSSAATSAIHRMADLTIRLTETETQLARAVTRMTQLLTAMKPDARESLLKAITETDFSKATLKDVALSFLFDASLPPPTPIERRSVKKSLMNDQRLLMMAAAVSAETKGTREEKLARVLERTVQVLLDSGRNLALFTPGFASGKHWAPAGRLPTTGSAAYSRFNCKYYALGYKTLVPVFIDERPVVGETLWQERKAFALEVEKHLHQQFKSLDKFNEKYDGREGGAEPTYSPTTRFYVYVAIKD
jgi:hypothetical protein